MAREKIAHYLDLAIYYGFHFLVFSIPLAFLPHITHDVFDLVKVTLLRITTMLMLAAWIIKQLLSRQIVIKRTRADVPILIFLILVTISTFTSIHLLTSIFGKYRRYEGMLTLINYALLFFLATQTFSEVKRVKALQATMVLTVIPVATYGISQYLGYDFIEWTERFEVNRSSSTLGNPIFLAGYLVLILPLILSRYFKSVKPISFYFYGGTSLLVFASILTTFSRGGWLAAFVAVFAFSLLVGKKVILSKKTGFLLLVLVLVFLITFTVNYEQVSLWPGKSISLAERVSSIPKVGEGSSYSRLLIWQSALKMIKSRPLFGWGVDTFRLAFPPFASLEYAQVEGQARLPDNAHNYFLQLASTLGLLGLLALLTILVFLFWQGKKLLSLKDNNYFLYSGLMAGISGYLTHLLFGINVIATGTIFWIIAGLIFSQESKHLIYQFNRPKKTFAYSLIIILVVLIFTGTIFFSFRVFLADIHFEQAQRLKVTGYLEAAVDEYNSAIQLNPYLHVYLQELASLYLEDIWQTGSRQHFNEAVEVLLRAEKMSPLELNNYALSSRLYLLAALEFDSRYYPLAREKLLQLLKIYPYGIEAHRDLGIYYLQTGRFKKALSELQWVLKINSQDTQAYLYLGQSYEALNDFPKARQAYQSVLKLEPENEEAKEGLRRMGE